MHNKCKLRTMKNKKWIIDKGWINSQSWVDMRAKQGVVGGSGYTAGRVEDISYITGKSKS